VILALAAIGVLCRALPLTDLGGRLLRQFPIDDGYLMLTIARNMALGLGMSVSGGTVPTNGTQPLMTLVYAGLFSLVGGERVPGVRLALLLQLLMAVLSALCIVRLLRRLLAGRHDAANVAAFTGALWLASPLMLPQTMNTLETGGYVLGVLLVALVFCTDRSGWRAPHVVGLGGLLGLVFLVRNDAIFLIAAVCMLHWLRPSGAAPARSGVRLAQTIALGLTSIVVAAPWLYFNVSRFGHLVPVSGRSEAIGWRFGGNVSQLVTVLPEYVFVVLQVPESVRDTWPGFLISAAIVLIAIPYYVRLRRATSGQARDVFDLAAGFLACLSIYYGLFFGAPWFMSRYLSVVSPFLAMAFTIGLVEWLSGRIDVLGPLDRAIAGTARRAAAVMVMGVVIVGLNVRLFIIGSDHPHFQMWEWVRRNVPDSVWIAAPQSGVLGFFHDRTLNMDGKVSEAALQARLAHRSLQYAIEQGAVFIVDWQNITDWANSPELAGRLEVVVNDPNRNLGVLRVASKPGDGPAPDPPADLPAKPF
jgi:hypothetical protein